MSKPKSTVDNLLAAIQRKTASPSPASLPNAELKTSNSPAAENATVQTIEEPRASKKTLKATRGKAIQFWMHEGDAQLIRELYAWLAGQGIRPTDSMVVRAALRTAKVGGAFLEACREVSKLDGRRKP